MGSDALAALVLLPLVAATLAAVLPAVAGRALVVATVLALPGLLWEPTASRYAGALPALLLAGYDLPLAIRLRADGLSLILLWLVAAVAAGASVHAWSSIGASRSARRFWPLWAMLLAGLNLLLLSADLFNLYVGLELVTLAAVALVAFGGKPDALRAAMRYLLLALLGSLVYLLGVALVHAASGTLDVQLAGSRLAPGPLPAAALALLSGGLLLKAAIFPLHGWLPFAHASAPGPVSAVLSALVVKACLYLLYRLWFDGLVPVPPAAPGALFASLGAGGVIFGSLLALRQQRLKRLVAYSTVAQLGYLMLLFALPTAAAWQGSGYHVLSHGLAKAAMFLAAANLVQIAGSDALERLRGVDARLPVSTFAFALAGISLMGLPPSGGFLAKWLLLTAAWSQAAWLWVAVLLIGSLLAAAYLFRVLTLVFARPADGVSTASARPAASAEWAALVLALAAIALGFAAAPVLALLGVPEVLHGEAVP
jgi:multicomponent Na+:H+ antiporter subunit D